MKKLLVLFVVLALAASASAAPVYVDVEETGGTNAITVEQEETFTVYLVSNIDMTGIGDIDEGDDGWWVTSSSVNLTMPTTGDFNEILDSVTSDDLSRLFAIDTSEDEFVAAGNEFFSFDVTAGTVDGIYSITVSLDTGAASFWDTVPTDRYEDLVSGTSLTVTVIPEPVTIALLGLGGLLLRRKE